MQGESHELCYDQSNAYLYFTTTFVLSEIEIDWKVASISCEADDEAVTGYAACSASDDFNSCGAKSMFNGFGWLSYGDNTDVTGVDMPVIGIYAYGQGGSTVTVYQSDDCSGPSMSEPAIMNGSVPSISQNLNQIQNNYDFQGSSAEVNAQVSELASIRVPSGLAVDLYNELNEKPAPFRTIFGDSDTCLTFEKGAVKSLRMYNSSA